SLKVSAPVPPTRYVMPVKLFVPIVPAAGPVSVQVLVVLGPISLSPVPLPPSTSMPENENGPGSKELAREPAAVPVNVHVLALAGPTRTSELLALPTRLPMLANVPAVALRAGAVTVP